MRRLSLVLRVAAAACAPTLIVPAAASATEFGGASGITINDNANATPYPSIIQVSGLSGRVSKVTVTLSNLTHSKTSDIAAVLEAPDGTSIALMDAAGSGGTSAQTFLFRDSAAQFLPSGSNLTSGSYKPTAYAAGNFPSPGPGLTYCKPAPVGACTLAGSLNGHSPNGAWQLYIHDFVGTNSGNVAGGWLINIDTDAVSPETTVDSGPTGPTADSTPTFGFSAGEAGSTFECRFDAEAFGACSGPAAAHTAAVALSDGAHVFEARATDPFGNVDASPAQRSFTVDTVAPDTAIAAAAVAGRDATFGFHAAEPATFTCSLDGAAPAACTSPAAFTGLADGSHSLSIVATDAAGNVDGTPAVKPVTIAATPTPVAPAAARDTRAPAVAVIAVKVNAKRKSAKLTWIAVDDVTAANALTYECKLDKAAFKTCRSPATFKKLKPGAHKLQLRAKDAAGNTSSVITKSFRLKKPRK